MHCDGTFPSVLFYAQGETFVCQFCDNTVILSQVMGDVNGLNEKNTFHYYFLVIDEKTYAY